jgi:nucleoside-diphosphate-sugar epimerase
VFVAGATGLIGSAVVRLLREAGHETCALVRSEQVAERLRGDGVGVTVCDLFDAELLRGALAVAEPDVVMHQLTALPDRIDPRRAAAQFAANDRMRIEGTRVLIEAAAATGASRVVAQSVAFAYAPDGDWVKDEDAPLYLDSPSPWGSTVGAVAELERQVLEARGMDGVVLRYGHLYGPGTWYGEGGQIADDVGRGQVALIGEGEGMYSFTHVDDAAAAAIGALDAPPGIYNVVDDEPVRARDWLPLYAGSLGAPEPPRLSVPEALERAGWTAVHRMTEQRGASNARGRSELG